MMTYKEEQKVAQEHIKHAATKYVLETQRACELLLWKENLKDDIEDIMEIMRLMTRIRMRKHTELHNMDKGSGSNE